MQICSIVRPAVGAMMLVACATTTGLAQDAKCNADCNADGAMPTDATIRIGFAGPGAILDPHRQTQAGEGTFTTLVFDRLTRFSSDRTPIPMLATEWSFAADGSYLEMKLRSDVVFNDGTPFDAEAVKINVERAKTVTRSGVARYLTAIAGVEVVDQYVVRFKLVPGLGRNLPTVLATNAGAMISPRALSDVSRDLALGPGDAGSGPYIVRDFKPNQIAVYERAARKPWDAGAGLPKRIEIGFMPPDQRLRAFQTGALDVAQMVGTISAPALKYGQANAATINAQTVGGGTQVSLLMRSGSPLLADSRVRKAIAMAVDRATVARVISDGICVTANQYFPPGSKFHMSGYEDFTYDREGAKALIAEAGAVGREIRILAGAGGYWDQAALAIQSMLEDIGLKAQVLAVPVAESVAQFRAGGADALVYSMAEPIDPATFFAETLTGGYALASAQERARLLQLLDQTQDPKAAEADIAEATKIAVRAAGEMAELLPICWVDAIFLSKKSIKRQGSIELSVASARDFRFLTAQQ